jgi:hypothetical protein
VNKRIRELAEQAGLKVNADGEIGPAFFGSVDAGYKKFAELIVRECAKSADEWYQNHNDIHWDPAQHIKNHFGVES